MELDFIARGLSQSLVASDVPDHTRLHSLMNLSFTPRLIEQWHEHVQAIIDELLDTVQEKGEMELIEHFAYRLPLMVITEMLGIPAADHEKFHTWSNVIVESEGSAEAPEHLGSVIPQFHGYLVTLLQEKRKHPADDLLVPISQSLERRD
ncbi:cytochrome P450 [Ktedonobacter racemifer]|uniref:cytochrome P450 n=1 Tax=Ktedonobacter racemifer TaxID=363277 RepID=UPI0006962C89|nr:cytochrome P450 [Ktedonobacter racemifer]